MSIDWGLKHYLSLQYDWIIVLQIYWNNTVCRIRLLYGWVSFIEHCDPLTMEK